MKEYKLIQTIIEDKEKYDNINLSKLVSDILNDDIYLKYTKEEMISYYRKVTNKIVFGEVAEKIKNSTTLDELNKSSKNIYLCKNEEVTKELIQMISDRNKQIKIETGNIYSVLKWGWTYRESLHYNYKIREYNSMTIEDMKKEIIDNSK